MREEEYLHLVRRLDEFLAAFEESAPTEVQEQVGNLLTGIDLLHREGLQRLVGGLREGGAGDAVDRVAGEDRVVAILLGLYDLAELPVPEEPEPPAQSAPAPAGGGGAAIVPLDSLRRRPRAEWTEVARVEELVPGAVRSREADGVALVLLEVDHEVYAFRERCPSCDQALGSAYLVDRALTCAWCGGRWDARTGAPEGSEPRLEPLPVSVVEGSVRLARLREGATAAGEAS